jgi:hypothetical protein
MPYIVNKTDGSIVATVTDGTIDNSSTSLTLIGKNYKGIGEIYNENLVFLLENFANSTPPTRQIRGQLWFNSNTNKVNVYDGVNWRPVGSPFLSTSRPDGLVAGDLWIDRSSQQLKFFDGNNLLIAGPSYTSNQGKTGWIPEEIIDRFGNSRVVASMYVGNVRVAIFNEKEFFPLLPISGFNTELTSLKAGLTFNTLIENNNINAPAETAIKLIDPIEGELSADKFVRSDRSSSIDGSLTVLGSNGIIVGPNANFSVSIELEQNQLDTITVLSNRSSNSKTQLEVKTTDEIQLALEFDPVTKTVSVYPEDQWQSANTTAPIFDINANTTVYGSLTVIGETKFTNATTLQITDKNIELAVVTNPTNTTADGAGITVLASPGNNKTLTWLLNGIFISGSQNLSVWQFNDNLRLTSNSSYYIGNESVLSSNTLGNGVINSSLRTVGNLLNLTVDDVNFDSNKLLVLNEKDLIIQVDLTKNIVLENRVRILNVESPITSFDVANKDYVDAVKTLNNFMTVDITGLVDPNVSVLAQINALFDPFTARVGDKLRVLCLSYANLPTVSRTVKLFECDLVNGARSWVYQAGQDIIL